MNIILELVDLNIRYAFITNTEQTIMRKILLLKSFFNSVETTLIFAPRHNTAYTDFQGSYQQLQPFLQGQG